jgi:hypothetical protein
VYIPGKADNYDETTESCPMGGGDDDVQCFLLSAYRFIPLHPPVGYVNQPKALVARRLFVVIATGMARGL